MTNWMCKVRENYRAKRWSARLRLGPMGVPRERRKEWKISGCKSCCSVIPIIPGYKVMHFSLKEILKRSRCLEKRGQVRGAAGLWVALVQQDRWGQVSWGAGPQGCATWIPAAEQGSPSAFASMKALIGLSLFPVCPEIWKGFSSLKPPLFYCI